MQSLVGLMQKVALLVITFCVFVISPNAMGQSAPPKDTILDVANSLASDSGLKISSYAGRVGINTFAYRNSVLLVSQPSITQHLNIIANTEQIYNRILQGNKYVSNDIITQGRYRKEINKSYAFLSEVAYTDYAVTRTRIALAYVGLGSKLVYGNNLFSWQIMGGGIADKRLDFSNQGAAGNVVGGYTWLSSDSTTKLTVTTQFAYASISPRLNTGQILMALLETQFNKFASAQLFAGITRRRVEDYFNGNVQSIKSDTLYGGATINYQLAEGLYFKTENTLSTPNRQFNYRQFQTNALQQDVNYLQTEGATRSEIALQTNRLNASFRGEYKIRDRAYDVGNNLILNGLQLDGVRKTEQIKDITEQTYAYFFNGKYAMAKNRVLSLNTISQLLRVDTRSELNNQDRDEVLYAADAIYTTQPFRNFKLSVRAYGSFRHFVYISTAQSIENFKERILKLEPSFRYSVGRLSWVGNYSVFVTYNVRDFSSEADKNRANRIFSINQNIKYRVDKHYTVFLDGLRRENRLGQLNWQTFKEAPLDTVVIYDITAKLQRAFLQTTKTPLTVALGYRIFRQSRKNISGVITNQSGTKTTAIDNITLQHGPVLSLNARAGRRFTLAADGWLQLASIYNNYSITSLPFIGAAQTEDALKLTQNNTNAYFNLYLFYVLP